MPGRPWRNRAATISQPCKHRSADLAVAAAESFRTRDPHVIAIAAVISTVMEVHRALQEREQLLASLYESLPVGILHVPTSSGLDGLESHVGQPRRFG